MHYSEDSSTAAATENARWGSTTSPRLLESIRQVEQYGQEHTSRVQQLQVCFTSLAAAFANRCLPSVDFVVQRTLKCTVWNVRPRQAALASQNVMYRHSASSHSVLPRFRGRASNTMLYDTAVLQ